MEGCLKGRRVKLCRPTLSKIKQANNLLGIINTKEPAPVNKFFWTLEDFKCLYRSEEKFFLVSFINKPAVIGYVSLNSRNIFEIALSKENRHKGVGVEASLLLFDFLFNKNPSVSEIYTFIHARNKYSLKCALSFGWIKSAGNELADWEKHELRRGDYNSSTKIKRWRERLIGDK